MKIGNYISYDEIIVDPFVSVSSIEDDVINHGYVVVKDNDKFLGIVTQSEIIKSGHNLVIDCLCKERKKVYESENIHEVIESMVKEQDYIIPVFDDDDNYKGCLTFFNVLKNLFFIKYSPRMISINNIVGSDDVENAKNVFSKELNHHLLNPIQVMYSSINLYKDAEDSEEKEFFIESIYDNIKKIDAIVKKLLVTYL